MDELEIEKVPLGSGPGDETPAGRPVTATLAPPHGSQPSLRRRLGAIASLVAVLLVGILIATATPGSRAALRSVLRLPTPTATPTLAFGSDYVYFENAVPWAQPPLIDGKPVPQSISNPSAGPTPFRIPARGRHTLDYAAAPFPALHCRFTVPAAKEDTCPLGSQADLSLPGTVKQARVLDLGGVPSRLPADQLAALDRAVRTVVDLPDATAQVLPGERYRTLDGIQVATEPLTATLSYGLSRDLSITCEGRPRCSYDCGYICAAPPGNLGSGWHLEARVGGRWRYTTANGSMVADGAPMFPPDATPQGPPPTTRVTAEWTGAWHVSSDFGPQSDAQNPTCNQAPLHGLNVGANGNVYFDTRSAANPAEGCLFIDRSWDPTTHVTSIAFTVLYRFGVLLATDDAAYQLNPQLPLADPHEQLLARQLTTAFLAPTNQQGPP